MKANKRKNKSKKEKSINGMAVPFSLYPKAMKSNGVSGSSPYRTVILGTPNSKRKGKNRSSAITIEW